MSLRDANVVNSSKNKRVAVVVANPSTSTTTGWPVGFWWSEVAHPYLAFHEAGYEVEFFSPKGGACEADAMSDPRDPSGYSADDLVSMGFLSTPALAARLKDTKPVSAIDVARFDAIVVAGGQSPMFSFETATDLHKIFSAFYEAGKIASALCHGVAVLKFATRSNGELIAKGKTVTGFANVEEDFADNAVWSMGLLPRDKHVMPWRIEDALREAGANFVQAGVWRSFAVRDGNLITGQQNFSGAETARLVIRPPAKAQGGAEPLVEGLERERLRLYSAPISCILSPNRLLLFLYRSDTIRNTFSFPITFSHWILLLDTSRFHSLSSGFRSIPFRFFIGVLLLP